ncbi:amino acid adenylation domain-containing protein [Streptomyces apocyni]|uniref:amino acid adenylation domain-containing protein n=1 Tax=Streptomyces apocyni TaxID=2654677 RepID=UPI0018D0167F|nr:amino acid adenylation domain-containing protein [Streptomyces apocyni]
MKDAADGPAVARGRTLTEIFERQADRIPDAVAVVGEDGSLTYRELDEAANHVAHELTGGGLRPGQAVLCAFPRGSRAVVAQLAVYKAGAVHVPVDPAAPAARLRYLAERTRAAAVLTDDGGPETGTAWDVAAGTGAGNGVRTDSTVGRDVLAELTPLYSTVGLDQRSARRPDIQVDPEETAYIIFTSGSTGEPKGVVVSHRAIVSTTLARFRHYPEPVTRFLMIWQMTFDAAIGCVWWALASGGTAELAPASLDGIMAAVDAMLTGDKRISHTAMTPSHYRTALRRLPGPSAGPAAILVAGEPCPPQLVTEHARLQPMTRLYNEYGPTEAAVWCTGTELRTGEEITAGTAIEGTGILVLDEAGQPVSPGGRGEVYVTGAGLATGYLQDPHLTSQRFLDHPDGRRYRTGDLGRLLPDGRLVVVGRTDHQLKIRGHRVEPGEIEAVLQTHPDIAQAVVTENHGQLIAFVVRRAAADPAPLAAR